jgi:hypothetical protein
VVTNPISHEAPAKRVVDFEGEPADLNPVLQKVVTYYTFNEASALEAVPKSIKNLILDPKAEKKANIVQESGA